MIQTLFETSSGAYFSPCRTWRYSLWRIWASNASNLAAFIGLNPSTADEMEDDPTIRRCIGFAKRLNCDGVLMLNLFAFRATDPKVMVKARNNGVDIVGPENTPYHLQIRTLYLPYVIAAWGAHKLATDRGRDVMRQLSMCKMLYCLGKTKGGHPKHPLYLPATAPLIPL